MRCEQLKKLLTGFPQCVETEQGTRFTTQCLYPSFDPVEIFVVKYGDGYRVHDGGGAARSAYDHGRDVALAHRMLERFAASYHLQVIENSLIAEAKDEEWLLPAILAVANASSSAAHATVERVVIASEAFLKERIFGVLVETVPQKSIAKEYEVRGKSGKIHSFDFAVHRVSDGWLLLSAVAPHHVSIAAKYVSFADTGEMTDTVRGRMAVVDKPLEQEDVSLLQQVADIVPFTSLREGVKREMARG